MFVLGHVSSLSSFLDKISIYTHPLTYLEMSLLQVQNFYSTFLFILLRIFLKKKGFRC